MGSVIVISETEPVAVLSKLTSTITWMKIHKDGSAEFYELENNEWVKVFTIPVYSLPNHKHSKVSAKITTPEGILTFKDGILTSVDKGE